MVDLSLAWNWRSARGLFDPASDASLGHSVAVRVFHGPGEGSGDLQHFAVDRFNDHYWVTQWDHPGFTPARERVQQQTIVQFLREKGALSVVGLGRPQRGVAPQAEVWWGESPDQPIIVREGQLNFWIRLRETRHPGLFLDHYPLRQWLLSHSRGLRVLNGFAYTGSLSLAAAAGGAQSVTTLDLSKPSIQWAQENFELNGFQGESYRFIAGDVFEWLPRLRRSARTSGLTQKSEGVFDCVILDPPSFSHGKKGNFSTAKDLTQLHKLALDLLAPGGFLVTSINSANVSWQKFEGDLLSAAREQSIDLQILRAMDLPETFPTRLGHSTDRYLKGWILRRTR